MDLAAKKAARDERIAAKKEALKGAFDDTAPVTEEN